MNCQSDDRSGGNSAVSWTLMFRSCVEVPFRVHFFALPERANDDSPVEFNKAELSLPHSAVPP